MAVGGLAALADWAAFRMRATIEAAVPSLTLFIFTSYLHGRQDRTQLIAIELAALVAFFVVQQYTVGRDRAAWFANRTQGALGSAMKTGAVIGLVALVVCLNLAFRLPGAGDKAVLKLRPGDHGARIAPDPLVDVRSRLLDHSGLPLFTVKASTASYWRLTSLDTYSGTEWTANDSYSPVHTTLPKDGASAKGVKVEQDFTIRDLDSPWLPAAYQPESISGPDVKSGISYDPDSGSLDHQPEHLERPAVSRHLDAECRPAVADPARRCPRRQSERPLPLPLPQAAPHRRPGGRPGPGGDGGQDDRIRQGHRPPELPALTRQLHLRRHLRPEGDRGQRPQLLPLHVQARLLPAVRRILRGHGPRARPAHPPRPRLDLRQGDRRHLERHRRRVPHLARGLLPPGRLGPL